MQNQLSHNTTYSLVTVAEFNSSYATPKVHKIYAKHLSKHIMVAVELYDIHTQHRAYVAHVPGHLLQLYTPTVAVWIEQDLGSSTYTLSIRIRCPKTVDVLVLGLQRVFQHMFDSHQRRLGHNIFKEAPQWNTIREGVGIYRALQLLHMYPLASSTRMRVIQHMQKYALNAYDVELLWQIFGPFGDLIEEMLRSLAYSDVRGQLPDFDWIWFYMDNERSQLTDAQNKQVVRLYNLFKMQAKRKLGGVSKAKVKLERMLRRQALCVS
ncbi:hypothetical protein K504DRAFT_248212 [Pleomassaria siparia CBS 279.74]|uniref:Uncharacterized protein n=1 Tax=Pleomassaria siparia CBS 279.74 TaxID=1314801 RepID=A0A6G1KBP5_9PLEO|nr:hypothetical protein K504DRAFT_248212 [Pleomassaria siparia CBS 279.74]